MPVRIRLALMFALGTGIVLAVTGILFYLQLESALRASLDASLQARSAALTTRLTATGGVIDDAAITSAGVETQLLDQTGKVLAAAPRAHTVPLVSGPDLSRARAGSHLRTVHVDGDKLRVLAGPLVTSAGPAVVAVAAPTEVLDVSEDRVRDIMVLACGPMIALAAVAAWMLSGAALRPVERMRRQATALGVADAGGRLAVPGTRDEIAALARTMNDLLERLYEARARDKAFVADAGHELRTPLTILKTELELASRPGRSRAELADAVANAATETDRLVRLAEDLLALARFDAAPDELHREPLDLADLLATAARGAAALTKAADVTIAVEVDVPTRVTLDGDRVRQAVDNLLANAVRHAPSGSTVELAARMADSAVVLSVRDHGPGFPPAFLPHAFERFRRADDARTRADGGAGLGLAIVAAIAHAHRGTATAANHPDGGALVTVILYPL